MIANFDGSQAANVDATLSRLKHQHALQQEKMRLAAAAAKGAAEQPVKDEQLLDPSFSPNGLGSGQFAPPEAEDRAGGAAQMAHQMSQVCWDPCLDAYAKAGLLTRVQSAFSQQM